MGIFVSSDAKIDEGIKEVHDFNRKFYSDWNSFVVGGISKLDNPKEVVDALREFIYILEHTKMGTNGLNGIMKFIYSDFFDYIGKYTNESEHQRYNTCFPILSKPDDFIENFIRFDAAIYFTIYYLSRQLLQSCGFYCTDGMESEQYKYTVTPRFSLSEYEKEKYIFDELTPKINNLRYHSIRRLGGIEVDKINVLRSPNHVFNYFVRELTSPDSSTTKIYLYSGMNDTQKSVYQCEFALWFNPFLSRRQRFDNKNILERLKQTLEQQQAYKNNSCIDDVVSLKFTEIANVKSKVFNWYLNLFCSIFRNIDENVGEIKYRIFMLGQFEPQHSFMGINRFGNFWCDSFHESNEEKKFLLNKNQSFYIRIMGYDNSNISNYTITIEDLGALEMEFEGNIHTYGGIRPILRTSSYYTNKKEYADDLSASNLRFYEALRTNENEIKFYTANNHTHFATFNRYQGCLQLHVENSYITFAPKNIVANSPIVIMYTM